MRNFPHIFGVACFALAVAICLLAGARAGKAHDSAVNRPCIGTAAT
jgi:hypothetical protein